MMKLIIISLSFIISSIVILHLLSKYNMKIAKKVFTVLICVLSLYLPIIAGSNILCKMVSTFTSTNKIYMEYFIEDINGRLQTSLSWFSATFISSFAIVIITLFTYFWIIYKLLGLIINYNKNFLKSLYEENKLLRELNKIIETIIEEIEENKRILIEKNNRKKYCTMLD